MSLKQRLAFRLKECFSAVGSRSESLSPPRHRAGRPEDDGAGPTPRNPQLPPSSSYKHRLGHHLRGGSAAQQQQQQQQQQQKHYRIGESQLAQLGLARRGGGGCAPSGSSPRLVEQVVSSLEGGDDDEKAWAAEVLLDLALEQESCNGNSSSASLVATVRPVVRMLQAGSAKARLCAAYALSALSGLEDAREEMEHCGAVKPLVALLRSGVTQVDGKKCVLRALERLARSDAASLQIFQAGGLRPIITLLGAEDSSLLKRCLVALYFVGADKEELQMEILKAGALPPVLELCRSAHQSVQAEAVDVCKVLARSSACSERMAEQGAVELLVRVAGEGLSQRARNTALQALQRMAEASVRLKEKITKLGAVLRFDDLSDDEISELVGIFSSGDDRLRAQAAKVVEQVAAADPKASRDLAEPEIVSSLINLLTAGSEEGRAYAAWALARLVEDVSVRDRVYLAGAVPSLLKVLGEGGLRSQEGAACALQKLASHKAAATEIVKGNHISEFLTALDDGTDKTQIYVASTLFLLRGVDVIVQDQLLDSGDQLRTAQHYNAFLPGTIFQTLLNRGACVLVRKSWRGTAEVQALAIAVLHDLCQFPANHKELMMNGVVPALLNLGGSKIKDVADMSCESLKLLGAGEFRSEVDAEIVLQDQITDMLQMVKSRNIRIKRFVEEALRLVPRGMFVEPHKVDFAYNSDAVLVTELDMELPPLHIHVIMLDALQLLPGHSFLEVGCSTGYLVGLAAYMVAPSGRAIGLEGDPGACAFAESQSEKLVAGRGLAELHPRFLVGDVSQLFENVDRFDRIAVSTSFARTLLGDLLALLKPNGRMVVPCEGQLLLIREELGLAGAEVLCAHDPNDGCHTDTSERILMSSDELSSSGNTTYTRSPSRIPCPSHTASSFVRRALGASKIPNPRRGSGDESVYFSASHAGAAAGWPKHDVENDGSKSARPHWKGSGSKRNGAQQRGSAEPPWASPRKWGGNLMRTKSNDQESPGEKSARKEKKLNSKNKKVGSGKEDKREEIPPELKGLMLSINDIKICRNGDGKKCRLGEGGFGMVYKAIMNNVDEVAVKVVKTEKPSHKELELFSREVKTLSSLHHRNIVQFYGACLEPGSLFFVTELMRGGDLYSALRNHKETMRWERLGKKVALDVALGVNYLHSQKPPMMHRDLKSPNVLLSEEGVAKIADVGMVKEQVKELVTAQPVMTPLWAAPEVMRKERASIKADVWSYGVLIWELVSGEDITDFQPLAMSRQVPSDKGRIMTMPDNAPEVAKKIFFECTQLNASDRPAMQTIVEWLRADGRR